MKGRSDIPLILGRFRPSERLTNTQVPNQCIAMRGGTLQPIHFSQPRWAGPTRGREFDPGFSSLSVKILINHHKIPGETADKDIL